jgi:hypothetical protein
MVRILVPSCGSQGGRLPKPGLRNLMPTISAHEISARTARIDDNLGRGTDGSNPPPSSVESAANFVFGREAWKGPRRGHDPEQRVPGVAPDNPVDLQRLSSFVNSPRLEHSDPSFCLVAKIPVLWTGIDTELE